MSHIKECLEHISQLSFRQNGKPESEIQSFVTAIPGCCPQRSDPSLEDPHEELEGILSNYHKIYGWKEDAAVDEESHDHGNHIHPKLLCNHFQVSDGDDLSTDKAGDTKR